jgi:hypothetical protein
MITPRKIFLFFLTNVFGQSYYSSGDSILLSSTPINLKKSPSNWLDQELIFGRNTHYEGLNRSYSPALKFVGDGATILRYLFYLKAGIEEPVFLIILKWDDVSGNYLSYYKGECDMSHFSDNVVEGVTVPVIEGGLLKLIKAYENTTFEIPCDGSIPENFSLKIHGIMFRGVFDYTVLPVEILDDGVIIPMVFNTSQGNSVGIAKGSPTYSPFNPALLSTVQTSSQYIFSSVAPVTLTVSGLFEFATSLGNGHLFLYTSTGQTVDLIANGAITGGQEYELNATISLQGGENLFLLFTTTVGSPRCPLVQNDIFLTFNSQFEDTNTYCIRPFDLLKLILVAMCQKASTPGNLVNYPLQSGLLKQYSNLALTCGMALRGEAGAVIKTTLAEFFDSFNPVLCASMGNQGAFGTLAETLFFEHKQYSYDPSTIDMDLGEVSELTVEPDVELFFDKLKIGYPEQKYDERAGNQEYNTTAEYQSSVTRISKELNLVSKYRADSYGIEYTRFLIGSSNTANNKSDNDVFIINVDFSQSNLTEVTSLNALAQIIKAISIGVAQGHGIGPTTILQQVSFGSVTGTGFAASFSLISVQGGINNGLQYINPSPTPIVAAINLQIKGQMQGIQIPVLSINLFGAPSGAHLEYEGPVSFFTRFQLCLNGTQISEQDVTLVPGKDFSVILGTYVYLRYGDVLTILMVPDSYNFFQAVVNTVALTLSTQFAEAVYSVLRAPYSAIAGLDNPADAYNIEDLTPARMVQKHGDYIRGILFNMSQASLAFQVISKNGSLVTTLNGGTPQELTISEGTDIPVGSLNSNILFLPLRLKFKTQVPKTFNQILQGGANAHIKGSFNGKSIYGFPMKCSVKPALEEIQDWDLRCSPLTNLSDLLDLNWDGFQLLSLMGYSTFISHLCPVKFVPLGSVLPTGYHLKHMDGWWFSEQITNYLDRSDYYAPWQTSDTIDLQLITNGLGPVQAQLYNGNGQLVSTESFPVVSDPSISSPNILYEGSISLSSLAAGIYYILITAGTGGTVTQHISEPLLVRADWPKTILFQYAHSKNKQSTVFTDGYNPTIRVQGMYDDFSPEAKYAVHEDQPADIPDWMIDKIGRILLLDTVTMDGLAITRDASAKFEKQTFPGTAKKYWSIQVREAVNTDGITLTTTGELDSTLVVESGIETDMFGPGALPGQVVQVQIND